MTSTPPSESTPGLVDEAAIAAALYEPPERTTIGSLIGLAIDQIKTLLTAQVELVKLKATRAAKKFGVGAGFLFVGLFLCLYLVNWIFRSIEMAFLLIVPPWAAALITTGIILLLIIILVAIGAGLISKGSKDIPDVPGEVQADVDAVKEGLGK